MPCHPLGNFLNYRVILERGSLEHADLLIEVYEVGLVQLVLSIFFQAVVTFNAIQELIQEWIDLTLLKNILRYLFSLLRLRYSLVDRLAELHQIIDHVLGNLDRSFGMAESLLMPVQLTQESADLHVDFALILQPLQLARRIRPVQSLDVRRVDLRKTSIQAKATFLERSHLLETKSHVVHRTLYQESIHRISLEHQSVQKSLRFLKQTQSSVVLLL